MSTALLIIDIQKDYFPGERMELAGNKAGQALNAFRERSLPVVHIQHVAVHPGATFFLPNTAGAEIHACVAPKAGEVVIISRRNQRHLREGARCRGNYRDPIDPVPRHWRSHGWPVKQRGGIG
jgi:nicotinamidase-related amidase